MSKLLKKSEGFTLIEIVLVLAIAGLILVIVFLAVAGAQRARRDTGRKDAVNRADAEFGKLVSDGAITAASTAAQAATALGNAIPANALPDRVTGFAAGACPTASTTTIAVATVGTSGTVCIHLEDGADYQRDVNP